MKIAIQGHPVRWKEVIQILKNLGGNDTYITFGYNPNSYYYINVNNNITYIPISKLKCSEYKDFKLYTLEEFEKEFPFKIGDKVIYSYTPNLIGTVVDIKFDDNIPYRVNIKETICTCGTIMLKPYKEMKDERNITLTLDKAKEWYKKGGELKEVALQAYSEEELLKEELPKSWDEFCKRYPIKKDESYINSEGKILSFTTKTAKREWNHICPSKKSAEAHLAMIQLEQLRDCYRGLFVTVIGMPVWCIIRQYGKLIICQRKWGRDETFLSFQSLEIAEKYLENFKPLIKQAGDLI